MPRISKRHSLVTAAAFALIATAAGAPSASAANSVGATSGVTNPYSPAYQHAYRHGVTPTITQNAKMKTWEATHAGTAAAATGPQTLSYGGGIDGIGVNSGHAKVYLVFYGSQWGSASTDVNGNTAFSGDPDHAAGAAQQMFKGIGTNNELWSADLTQWCDGAGVATGATACPATGASYIPYQSGGVLAGVWYDNSAASPAQTSGHDLGVEAVKAAGHFGNTSAASNRYAYYVILSPHGTNPDDYQNPTTGYCAWHDYNGDSSLTGGPVSSSYGDIAFSNQPYNIDAGSNCGVGFVNSPGTLDGWTMTLGHEWHEEMSDQNPAGGWTNHVSGSSSNGQENSDECAWLSPGTAGGAANISFGSFGTYAEQSSWSNDTNACAISHPIVNHGSTTTGEVHAVGAGKCLDVPGGTTTAGTQLDIWTCSGATNQIFTHSSSNQLTVYSGSSQKCLDASGGGTTTGTKVIIWSCNGQTNQQWHLNSNGTITGAQSGLCLDVTGASTADGALAELWTCNGGSNQQWTLG